MALNITACNIAPGTTALLPELQHCFQHCSMTVNITILLYFCSLIGELNTHNYFTALLPTMQHCSRHWNIVSNTILLLSSLLHGFQHYCVAPSTTVLLPALQIASGTAALLQILQHCSQHYSIAPGTTMTPSTTAGFSSQQHNSQD